MKITNAHLLQVLTVLFWIAFIGLCIRTGSLIVAFFVSLYVNPAASGDLYLGLNLRELHDHSLPQYVSVVVMLIVLTGLKASMAYEVIRISMKLNPDKPFREDILKILEKMVSLAVAAGLVALAGHSHAKWLGKRGIDVPIEWAYGEILFFAGILWAISLVFRKGTELQTEQDLTV